jgi:hypothetical protein
MSLLEETTTSETYYDKLVGEGRKFKDQEALAKGKAEADEYISMINRQKDEFRVLNDQYHDQIIRLKSELADRASLEDMLNQERTREPPQTTPAKTQPSIDFDVEFEKRLSDYERKKIAESNLNKVKAQLREKLGSDYVSTLRNKMDELELTVEEMDSLAARSPKAFMRSMGLEDQAPKGPAYQTPMSSTVNTTTLKPKSEERNWDWYMDLKAKDPQAWMSAKIQQQMYDDSQSLGARFATDDFNKYQERIP